MDTGFKLLSKFATWFASIEHFLFTLFSLVCGLSIVAGSGGILKSGALQLSVWLFLENLWLLSACCLRSLVVGMLPLASELFGLSSDSGGWHLRSNKHFFQSCWQHVWRLNEVKTNYKFVCKRIFIKKNQASIVNGTRYIHVSHAHWSDESSKKNQTSILNRSWEIHVSVFLHLCLLKPDRRTNYLQNRWSYVRGIYIEKSDLFLTLGRENSFYPETWQTDIIK